MFKMFIIAKKYFWTKPKWRILRIYTKQIPRHKLERLNKELEFQISEETDPLIKEYLRGKMGANAVPFSIDLKILPFYTGLTLAITGANSNATVIYE